MCMTLNEKKIIAAALSLCMFTATVSCTSSVQTDSGNSLEGLKVEEQGNGVVGEDKIYSDEVSSAETSTTTTTTTTSTTTTTTTTTAPNIKGDIYDVNGEILVYSNYEGDTEARYYNSQYKLSFATLLDEYSGGIDSALDEELRKANPTEVQGHSNVGQSVRLTVDGRVQNDIFQYLQQNGIAGSVVVMRTDGSVMAEVSYPTYDPEINRIDPNYSRQLYEGAFCNKALQNATPGSCFKIMSAVVSEKNGVTSLLDDGSWTDSGSTIHNWNWDTAKYMYPLQRSLSSAIVDSSNVFFAKSFQEIGAETVLSDLAGIFSFGNECDIQCDFGTLHNNIEIYCNDDLRRSAFGQSYVKTTPMYLAALGREAVFGDMVRPFTVKNYADTNDITQNQTAGSKSYDVICSIPQDCRDTLLEGMRGVAGNFKFYPPEGYTLYAKTGTAETGTGDYLYITGCLKNNNDSSAGKPEYSDYSDYRTGGGSYIIVMQIQNPQDHGFNFASDSAMFYKGIIDIVLSY